MYECMYIYIRIHVYTYTIYCTCICIYMYAYTSFSQEGLNFRNHRNIADSTDCKKGRLTIFCIYYCILFSPPPLFSQKKNPPHIRSAHLSHDIIFHHTIFHHVIFHQICFRDFVNSTQSLHHISPPSFPPIVCFMFSPSREFSLHIQSEFFFSSRRFCR